MPKDSKKKKKPRLKLDKDKFKEFQKAFRGDKKKKRK